MEVLGEPGYHPAPVGAPAIETRNLRKTYGGRRSRHVALDGLDLTVPRGGVHGFLGPNGSGKTTTIRMLLGLVCADSGDMQIMGNRVPEMLSIVVPHVGAIVERPRFFPAFSGRRNLELLAGAIDVPRARVTAVLEEMGISDRAQDPFRTYSLGMKQRLAIAGTLLKDPELLIFDEPTNGLDPAGIHAVRATMRALADRGKTVLVSSHLLSEVELVADTVSIIGRGRLLAQGSVQTLLAGAAEPAVRIRIGDAERAAAVLRDAGHRVDPGPEQTLLVRSEGPVDPARVARVLAAQDLFVSELVTVRPDLEQVFLSLTAGDQLRTDLAGGWDR